MPEHDALISEYSHLKSFPREKEALHALQKIASLVKPIMRARGWTVGTLAEFYPDSRNLLGTQGYPSPQNLTFETRLTVTRNQPEQRTENMPPATVSWRQEPVSASRASCGYDAP
jgi:hypothetical protein